MHPHTSSSHRVFERRFTSRVAAGLPLTSPMTGLPLPNTTLMSNIALRGMIHTFLESQACTCTYTYILHMRMHMHMHMPCMLL